jgi:hypothetical protein
LETLAVEAKPPLEETIRAVLSVGLLKSMQLDALRPHSRLFDLVKEHVEEGYKSAEILTGSKKYDSGAVGLLPPGSPPPEMSDSRKAFRELVRLRGFAVPAVQRLASDPSPASKKYAADVLIQLVATSQKDLLLKLGHDGGEISTSHGDYVERTTVGDSVLRTLKNEAPFRYWFPAESRVGPISEPEEYVSELCDELNPDSYTGLFPVTNALRQEAKTVDAKSWDEYWERARSVIEKIYRRTRE